MNTFRENTIKRITLKYWGELFFLTQLILILTCATCGGQPRTKAADLVVDNQLIDITSPRYTALFNELTTVHHFKRATLATLFKNIRISRKVLVLMDRQWEETPYYRYRPLFFTPLVITTGKEFLKSHAKLFDRIEKTYGVDREYIVAIWGIESKFGANQGSFNLFQTLNTLFDAYPRRSDFFRKELIHFLKLCRENSFDPLSITGSYAGAFGQAQFMPSSFNSYSVDFDGDNRRDLINSLPDIFASIAHYLKIFGWTLHSPVSAKIGTKLKSKVLIDAHNRGRKALLDWRLIAKTQGISIPRPPANKQLFIISLQDSSTSSDGVSYFAGYPNFKAITAYNHSNKYAMVVSELAEAFKQ